MTDAEIEDLLLHGHGWEVKEVNGMKRLEKVFKFKKLCSGIGIYQQDRCDAEEENHHPLIITEYGCVTVDWWTHVIKGLHRNDFIMVAKTDELFEPMQ